MTNLYIKSTSPGIRTQTQLRTAFETAAQTVPPERHMNVDTINNGAAGGIRTHTQLRTASQTAVSTIAPQPHMHFLYMINFLNRNCNNIQLYPEGDSNSHATITSHLLLRQGCLPFQHLGIKNWLFSGWLNTIF